MNLKPDNTALIEIVPLEFHRRQLHRLQHATGHIRTRYGGTISAGFKRGSVVKHPKYGFCYVGGWQESPTKKDPNRKTISLHSLGTGKRLTQNALAPDCKFKAYGSWRLTAVLTADSAFVCATDRRDFHTSQEIPMSTKKPRKSLEDSLASEFVYGSQKQPEVNPDPEVGNNEYTPLPQEKSLEPGLMSKLQAVPKEATVRFTVDMPQSMHRKLSMLAAKTGRKKVDIVRLLLEEALKDVEE